MNLPTTISQIESAITSFLHHNLPQIQTYLTIPHLVPTNFSHLSHIPPHTWGVYSFHVVFGNAPTGYSDLVQYWRKDAAGRTLICPELIQSTTDTYNFKAGQSVPLYVGKSEQLMGRINQHIHQKSKPTTYGLKLSQQNVFNSRFNAQYYYSFYQLTERPTQDIMALKSMLVSIEAVMRKELKPIIGKQ